jgi:hypothetical protein
MIALIEHDQEIFNRSYTKPVEPKPGMPEKMIINNGFLNDLPCAAAGVRLCGSKLRMRSSLKLAL